MKNRSAHWPQHRKHSIKYKPPLLLLLVSVAPGISKAEANLNVFAVGRKIHLDDKARDVLAVADAVQAGALHEVIEVDGVFGRTDGQEPAVRADPRESDPGARSPRGRAGGRSAPGPASPASVAGRPHFVTHRCLASPTFYGIQPFLCIKSQEAGACMHAAFLRRAFCKRFSAL